MKRAVEIAAAGGHNILTFGPIPSEKRGAWFSEQQSSRPGDSPNCTAFKIWRTTPAKRPRRATLDAERDGVMKRRNDISSLVRRSSSGFCGKGDSAGSTAGDRYSFLRKAQRQPINASRLPETTATIRVVCDRLQRGRNHDACERSAKIGHFLEQKMDSVRKRSAHNPLRFVCLVTDGDWQFIHLRDRISKR